MQNLKGNEMKELNSHSQTRNHFDRRVLLLNFAFRILHFKFFI